MVLLKNKFNDKLAVGQFVFIFKKSIVQFLDLKSHKINFITLNINHMKFSPKFMCVLVK